MANKININQNQLYSASGALDPRFIVDSADKITSISNAYVGLEVNVVDSENNTIKKYRIKKINSLTKKPLPANEGGYELIKEPKDLKYSDGTPFLNEEDNINPDPTINPLPSHSSLDNGKVLGLDNGNPTWVSQPDTSGKIDKVSSASGKLPKFTVDGNLESSNIDANSVLIQHLDISGKADKVTGSDLNNKLVILDENGNMKSSGLTLNEFKAELDEDYIPKPSVNPTDGQILSCDETDGTKWVDNTTVHIKYAATDTPTSNDMHDSIQSGDLYIGVYSDNSSIASTNYTDYVWSRIVGIDGTNGKSAYQAAIDAGLTTAPTEAQWVLELKANFGEYLSADYGTNGYPASNGTDITAANADHNKIYIVPNDSTTPTANIMFVSVSDGNNGYTWINLGEVNVSGKFKTGQNLDDVSIVQNLNTGGSDKVPSAEAIKELNEQLYGYMDITLESAALSLPTNALRGTYQNTTDASSTGTNAAWYHEGYAKSSGVIDLRAYKEAGYKYLKVTMNVNESNVHSGGFLTFVKRLDTPQAATSFNDLVTNGYLSSVHIDSNHVCINTPSNGSEELTTNVPIPEDAIGVLFQYKNTSGTISQATTFRRPKEVKCAGLIVGGDINDLKKETTDSETIGKKVGLLESAVDVPYNGVNCEFEVSDGYINGTTGVVTSHTTLTHAETTVSGISRLKFLGFELSIYTSTVGYAFYDENDTPISYARYDVNLDANTRGAKVYIVDVPDGAVTFRCTIGSLNSESFSIVSVEGDTVTEYVSPLITRKTEVQDEEMTYLWTSLVTGAVLVSDGSVVTGLNSKIFGYTNEIISVQPGDVLTAYFFYINDSGAEVVADITGLIRSVCCYKNGEVVSGGFQKWTISVQSSLMTSRYVVPFGCDGVKVTFGGQHSGYTRVKLVVTKHVEKEYLRESNNDSYNQFRTIEAMNAEVKYALPYADVWSNKVIVFSAKVTRDAENGIGTLTIGNTRLRTATWGSNPASITINDTTITTTSGISKKQSGSWQHGLTINNDIQVIIETDRSYNQLVKITLRSNGQEDYVISGDDFIQPYTDPSTQQTTNVRKKWGQASGARYAKASISGVFSEVSFSNIFKDLLSPVWIFGDSYCSNNGDSRWVYWAEEANVKNYLLSSFAGATSEDQIVSFRSLIAIHRPKVVCWFLGMNDPDSTGSTQSATPNSSWLSCVKEVIETCDRYGVQVVLATIPSVQNPTGYGPGGIYSNKAKNDWVRASGRRFYDEEAAVGATSDGWWIGVSIEGYGSNAYKEPAPLRETTNNPSFGVHPSTNGAKALFTRLLADVPEIMFKG